MFCMLSASIAVLAQGQAVWIIFFVLHRCVVAFLAVATRQRDYLTIVFLSHGQNLRTLKLAWPG